jgi:hypothetical protein
MSIKGTFARYVVSALVLLTTAALAGLLLSTGMSAAEDIRETIRITVVRGCSMPILTVPWQRKTGSARPIQ